MRIVHRNNQMRCRSASHVVAFALAQLLLASVSAVSAQTAATENGFQPNRDYLALQSFESIDTASGNVVLTFRDLALPGNNGRELTFDRVFNNMPRASWAQTAPGQNWHFSISGLPLQIVNHVDIPVGSIFQNSI